MVFWLVLLGAAAQGWTGEGASWKDHAEMIQMSMGMPQVGLEKYELPNGMHVILHVDRKLPIVHVNLCFHVGSKDEEPGRFGFAHLFEHMMFQGSKHADEQYIGLVEKAGANLFTGGVNGNTEEDRTNYFETVPSGNLEYILWLESDRVATLPEAITQKKFDTQREVVKNELRLQLSRPYGRASMLIHENIFPAGHPYAHHPIGNEKDLAAASLDDIKEFFRTYYTPSNLSLVIAGDFDSSEARKLVERYFAGIPAGPPLQHIKGWIPEASGQKILEVKDRVSQDRSYMAWVAPAFFDAGDAELDLVSNILTSGISSRLNRALVQEHALCTEVSSEHESFEAAGMFTLSATIKPGVEFADVEKAIADQIAQLARDGPTRSELSRAKMKWESEFIAKLEKIGGFGGKSDLLNRYSTFLGDPDKVAADIERRRAVTADAVQHAVQTWLAPHRGLLLRFLRNTSIAEKGTNLDRSQPPPLGKDSQFHAPQVQSARLKNGLEVFVAERHDLPKVAVTLVTRAGSASDPAGKGGLADLLVEAIKSGTEKMSTEELENSLADLGVSLEGQVDRDFSMLSLEALRANAGPATTIFADIIQRPVFGDDAVFREKERHLSWLAMAHNNSQYLGGLLSPSLAFGSDHPYGHPVQGLPSTVQTITAEDLRYFHSRYWKPGGAALIFAGDISFSEAMELAEKNFAGWPNGIPVSVKIPQPTPLPGRVFVVDMPGATQTMVRQILLLPGHKSPDYAAIQLADAVWGGGSAARLNLNLRENKGYAFAVFSHPFIFLSYGTWQSYGSVQAEKTRESLAEFRAELEGLAGRNPISPRELAAAKSNRVHGYTQQFESLASLSHEIAHLWSGDLPVTQFASDIDALQAVDLAAVNATARQYASPDKSRLLLIGDLEKLRPQLKSAGIENFEVIDSEGRAVMKQVH